ncbi:methylmalonyl-CoA mutase family protein [Psychrobacillus sp. FSL K6-2684]|uniref:methylmalonyl-CoA mutase family protein n=1 Tax=unclassified Psychrobacillus TaxID=2636677 RepID=UPI001243F511|nr:methylmalonyl-CoA mutase family protein [Psychrobacillus sp. AK 1817]QEY19494.1 hypothetical protein D0S48_01590 [Psychrobacillus sp. AK 1817]
MTINDMKQTNFTEASFADWEQAAIKSLKGKSLESLETKTLEDIILKPLYTLADLTNISLDQTNTVRHSKETANWKVAQHSTANTAEEIIVDMKENLSKGNDLINYKVDAIHEWSPSQIEELKILFQEHEVLLDVENNPSFLDHFDELHGFIIGADRKLTGARSLHLDGTQLHKAGGDVVSELASVLVQADTLAHLNGIEELEEKAFVQFSIDTNFFMEIAKLRAFRVLWKAFGEAFGKENINAIPVYTETSLRSFSALDSNVNLLRAGNSILSSVLGGADIVSSYPHNYLSEITPTSKRIARNMQLVLKEETHIQRVIDAAGGSYYIESLTKQLVEKTWAYFIDLMKDSSPESRESMLLQRASEKWELQLKAVSTRKKSLIGTNNYANPEDGLEEIVIQSDYRRLAEPFEHLRKAFKQYQLKAAILPYGVLKEYKPRMDYINGYLNAIGITPVIAQENLKPFDLQQWINNENIQYAIFVGSDEQTAGLVPALLNEKLSVPLDVAGKFAEYDDWLEAGLSGYIYAGQSMLVKGKELLALAQKEGSHDNA